MKLFLTILMLLTTSSYAIAQSSRAGAADRLDLHERAVALAREERFDEAIDILASLHDAEPENALYLLDYVATLSWAERDREAVDLARRVDFETAPSYVLLAAAKSARNTREYETARQLYTRAVAIDGANLDAHIGLALTLAESGDSAKADAVIGALSAEQRRDPRVLTAQAYIQRLGGQLVAALQAYDRLLASSPNDPALLRSKALVLRELLLPYQALELAERYPGILSDDEIGRLEVDALALQLRLAASTVYPRELDGQLLDQTIAAIDTHLDGTHTDGSALALRYDRIAALAERNMGAEAIEAYEALEIPFDELPAYVLAAAGKAYLQVERPATALRLLERAAEMPPVGIETTFALVFAYLDLDRYEEAVQVAHQAIADQPLLFQSSDSPVIHGNEDRIRAEILAALADASIDQLVLAQARLESLLADAPNNSDLRHELANIYRSRGWLDGALFEYDQVLTMNDDLTYAVVGKAHTQIDAQQYEDVDHTIDALGSTQNSDPIVERLIERWDLHNRSELLVEASQSKSSGTTFGSRSYAIDSYWFTPPIRYNHRPFVHLHHSFAEFPEGDARRKRVGVGSEYRANRWSARGELLHDRDTNEPGFAGLASWRMSDYWRLGASLELNSNETQLRGHRVGIEADLAGLSAEYTPSESRYYQAGFTALDYSDGNLSERLFGSLVHRVLTRPRSLTSVTAEVSTSRNSLQGVPYFAPSRDVGVRVGGMHEWRLHRRYDRSLIQRTSLQVGQYRQSGFDTGEVWRLGYAIEYRIRDALLVEFGAQRSRNFYDGAAEYDTSLLVTVSARLGR